MILSQIDTKIVMKQDIYLSGRDVVTNRHGEQPTKRKQKSILDTLVVDGYQTFLSSFAIRTILQQKWHSFVKKWDINFFNSISLDRTKQSPKMYRWFVPNGFIFG